MASDIDSLFQDVFSPPSKEASDVDAESASRSDRLDRLKSERDEDSTPIWVARRDRPPGPALCTRRPDAAVALIARSCRTLPGEGVRPESESLRDIRRVGLDIPDSPEPDSIIFSVRTPPAPIRSGAECPR